MTEEKKDRTERKKGRERDMTERKKIGGKREKKRRSCRETRQLKNLLACLFPSRSDAIPPNLRITTICRLISQMPFVQNTIIVLF